MKHALVLMMTSAVIAAPTTAAAIEAADTKERVCLPENAVTETLPGLKPEMCPDVNDSGLALLMWSEIRFRPDVQATEEAIPDIRPDPAA